MTSIKIGKDTATLLGVISRARNITVEKLILDAMREAFEEEVEAALTMIEKSENAGKEEGRKPKSDSQA